jgi:hypothetical protein
MTTKPIYKPIYSEMISRNNLLLQNGTIRFDPQLNNPKKDPRKGLAYFAFDIHTNEKFESIIKEAKKTFPTQITYEQNPKDPKQGLLHFTFLQLIGVKENMKNLPPSLLNQYIETPKKIFTKMPPFSITYKGLIAIPTGVIIYGYPSIDINPYREKIRQAIIKKKLPFHEPFKTNIAHSTFLRLANPEDPQKLITFAEKYRKTELGKININSLQLGYGTWGMKKEEIKMFTTLPLGV